MTTLVGNSTMFLAALMSTKLGKKARSLGGDCIPGANKSPTAGVVCSVESARRCVSRVRVGSFERNDGTGAACDLIARKVPT